MEVGADRKSLIRLAAALAVLAVVVYVQFFRGSAQPVVDTQAEPAPASAREADTPSPSPSLPASVDAEPGPAGEATLRKQLLERVRAIDAPVVARNIFDFGRPKARAVTGPTREEARRAQAKLEAAVAKTPPRRTRPVTRPARVVRPPNWKYYGLASAANSQARQAFLLDGEEILLASEGMLLQERYRVTEVALRAIRIEDIKEDKHFSIPLEFPQ